MFSFAELPKVRPFSLGFVVAIKQNSPESQRPRGIVQVKLCVLGRRGPRTMPFPRWLRFITALRARHSHNWWCGRSKGYYRAQRKCFRSRTALTTLTYDAH